MLDKVIEVLGENTPAILGFLIMFVVFLRHLSVAETRWQSIAEAATTALVDNTKVMTKLTTLIEERVPKAMKGGAN